MTSAERERMNELVLKIQQETDQVVFLKLVKELTDLIDQTRSRFPATD